MADRPRVSFDHMTVARRAGRRLAEADPELGPRLRAHPELLPVFLSDAERAALNYLSPAAWGAAFWRGFDDIDGGC